MILFTGSGALATTFAKYYDCEIISARLLDDRSLSKRVKNAKVIIHNAALIDSSDISKLIESNFILTKRIVEIAKRVKPDIKIINISSMSFLKDEYRYLDPLEMSGYAFSKYISELFCLKHSIKNIINVRFSTIFYGDYRRDGLSKLAHDYVLGKKATIYNNGEAVRDFIPLEIAVQYLYKLTQLKTIVTNINIVSGKEISFNYFVNKLTVLKPETKIINIQAETSKVLSVFSKDGIESLGEIQYNIDELFERYILKLNENINI
jgi:nucleoside-diphosphate-sugar epimerase